MCSNESQQQNKKTAHRMRKNVCEWISWHGINLWNIQTVHAALCKKNDPVKKWAEDLSGQFSKEDIQVTQKHMKRCLTLLIIREMQIKTIVTYNLARVRISVKSLSQVWLFVTPWTAAFQAPLSMGFSRQEYWSGLPSLSPGDLPNPGKIIRKSTDNQCWRGSGEKGTILYCWWECKLVKTTGENSIEVP